MSNYGTSTRKLTKVGNSLMLSIPEEYVRNHSLKNGDQVQVVYDDYLHVQPIDKVELGQRLEKAKEILEGEK